MVAQADRESRKRRYHARHAQAAAPGTCQVSGHVGKQRVTIGDRAIEIEDDEPHRVSVRLRILNPKRRGPWGAAATRTAECRRAGSTRAPSACRYAGARRTAAACRHPAAL